MTDNHDELRWGVALPQRVADGTFDPAAFRTHVARAEALGFHSAWTVEQVLGASPVLAPLETMAYAAAATERIRLGCAVFVSPLHSPVHLAKSIATLDQLSRGRIDVGVGVGGTFRMLSAFGIDADGLVARFNEGVQLMRALWSEPQLTFDGRFWQLKGATIEPRPVQKPGPPIWFGGSHPAALRRAVQRSDGFFGAGSTTTAAFAEQVGVVRHALADAERDPATFPIAKRVYIAVDDDAERARAGISAALHEIYGSFGLPDLTPVAVYGPSEACRRGLQDVADAGARLILVHPLSDGTEQMERLAAEVIPAVR